MHIYYQYRLDFFNPDYSNFINIDIKSNELFIEDTYTGQIVKRIPKDIVALSEDRNPFTTICRMLWVDNKTLKVVSEEGSEKVLDVENDLKCIAHNEIPLFN